MILAGASLHFCFQLLTTEAIIACASGQVFAGSGCIDNCMARLMSFIVRDDLARSAVDNAVPTHRNGTRAFVLMNFTCLLGRRPPQTLVHRNRFQSFHPSLQCFQENSVLLQTKKTFLAQFTRECSIENFSARVCSPPYTSCCRNCALRYDV